MRVKKLGPGCWRASPSIRDSNRKISESLLCAQDPVTLVRLHATDVCHCHHDPPAAPTLRGSVDELGARLADAAVSGDVEEVRALIRQGADLEHKVDGLWETPLHLATQHGRVEVVRILIAEGADLNATSGNVDHVGMTALDFAVRYRHFEIAEVLLDAGVVPGLSLFGADSAKMVRILIEAGADPSLRAPDGSSALFPHAAIDEVESLEALLDAGVDINAVANDGSTASMWAVRNGHLPSVKLLVQRGTDPRADSDDGHTSLSWAVENDHRQTAAFLEGVISEGTPK